jgi:hypothetical protein
MYAPWIDWREENALKTADRLRDSEYITDVWTNPCSKEDVWVNAKPCWEKSFESDASHHMVVQGDVILCDGFGEAFTNALSAVPDRMVSPFSVWMFDEEYALGTNWSRVPCRVWGAAVSLPVEDARDFVNWTEDNISYDYEHDDMRLSAYNYLEKGTDVWLTQPSLAEHEGGKRESSLGHNPPVRRIARYYVGNYDIDPTEIDWSFNLKNVPKRTVDSSPEKTIGRVLSK